MSRVTALGRAIRIVDEVLGYNDGSDPIQRALLSSQVARVVREAEDAAYLDGYMLKLREISAIEQHPDKAAIYEAASQCGFTEREIFEVRDPRVIELLALAAKPIPSEGPRP